MSVVAVEEIVEARLVGGVRRGACVAWLFEIEDARRPD
jgi:hypothetical protein